MKKFLHSTGLLQAAQPFSRIYKKIEVKWRDKIHKSDEGERLLDGFVDKHMDQIKAYGITKVMSR